MTDVAASQRLSFFDAAFYAIAAGIGMRWLATAAADGPAAVPIASGAKNVNSARQSWSRRAR